MPEDHRKPPRGQDPVTDGEPARLRLRPGFHRLPLPTPFPIGPVNAYLLEGEPLTLIDPGPVYEPARAALVEGLRGLGFETADIEQVVITHPHVDHYGACAEIVEASGARVAVHALAAERLGLPLHRGVVGEKEALEAMLLQAGAPEEFGETLYRTWSKADALALPVQADLPLEEGDTLQGGGVAWRVLATPGHAPASVCLFDDETGCLMAGDTLLENVSSNAILEFRSGEQGLVRERSLETYLTSLTRLAGLGVTRVLPGHGRPFTEHRKVIAARMEHYEARKKAILGLLSEMGPAPAFRLSRVLFPGESGVMGQFLALSEVIGHLDLLEAEGNVRYRRNGTVGIYEPVSNA